MVCWCGNIVRISGGEFASQTPLKVLYQWVSNNGSIGSSSAKRIPHSDEIKASSCSLTSDCQGLCARQYEVTACRSCELCVSKEHWTWMGEEPPLFMAIWYLCWNVVLGWRNKKNDIFSKLQKQTGIEQGFCQACAQHRRERHWEYVSACAQKLLLLFWRNKIEAIKQKELNPVVGDLNSGWWVSPVASRNSFLLQNKMCVSNRFFLLRRGKATALRWWLQQWWDKERPCHHSQGSQKQAGASIMLQEQVLQRLENGVVDVTGSLQSLCLSKTTHQQILFCKSRWTSCSSVQVQEQSNLCTSCVFNNSR